jgi:hypothetical protein
MPSRYSGIRADGLDNWDLSVIKNTYFTERIYLQFRVPQRIRPPAVLRAEYHALRHHVRDGHGDFPMLRLIQFGLKLFF